MKPQQYKITEFRTGKMPILSNQEKTHYLAFLDAGGPIDAPILIPRGSVSGSYFEKHNINYHFFHMARE